MTATKTKTSSATPATKPDPARAIGPIVKGVNPPQPEQYEQMFRDYMTGKRKSHQHAKRYFITLKQAKDIRNRVRVELGPRPKRPKTATKRATAARPAAILATQRARDTAAADGDLIQEAIGALLRERDTAVAEAAIAFDQAKRGYRQASDLAKRAGLTA